MILQSSLSLLLLLESKLETRDNKLAVSHSFPLHSHTFLRGTTARAANVSNPWKFNFQPGLDNKRPIVNSQKTLYKDRNLLHPPMSCAWLLYIYFLYFMLCPRQGYSLIRM